MILSALCLSRFCSTLSSISVRQTFSDVRGCAPSMFIVYQPTAWFTLTGIMLDLEAMAVNFLVRFDHQVLFARNADVPGHRGCGCICCRRDRLFQMATSFAAGPASQKDLPPMATDVGCPPKYCIPFAATVLLSTRRRRLRVRNARPRDWRKINLD